MTTNGLPPGVCNLSGFQMLRDLHKLPGGASAPQRHVPQLRLVPPLATDLRIGVIHNIRARHNISRHAPRVVAGCEHAMPRSHDELEIVLANFAAQGVNALIIDGGDGTVRDVMTVAAQHYAGDVPRLAIVPSGKTNALALDLGIPGGWTTEDAVAAVRSGGLQERSPIEIWRAGQPAAALRGFIFGAGAFVRATALAQTTHRLGAFNGMAVGLSIAGAVAQTIFGRRDNPWRRGEPMRVAPAGGAVIEAAQYLLLGSTLTRMPLGVRPFGAPRGGLKMLRIDASPRRMLAVLPSLLGGSNSAWLAQAGYHREDAERIGLRLDGDFILDGEVFPGGEITLRQGAPLRFVLP